MRGQELVYHLCTSGFQRAEAWFNVYLENGITWPGNPWDSRAVAKKMTTHRPATRRVVYRIRVTRR